MVLNRMHETLQRGESPVEDILHGFFLLVAGLFFLLPGFITDSIAVLLATPPIRAVLGKIIVHNIRNSFYKNTSGYKNSPNSPEGIIINGEYEEEKDDPKNIDHKG